MMPLVLKSPNGWFAAGVEVQKAMAVLSDGAFKLFVYLCLNAQRAAGVLETTQTELAHSLKKGHASIRAYLREMEAAGVCRCQFRHSGRGMVEMAEAYWPYQKPEQEMLDNADNGADAFVSAIRKLLQARACVQTSFSAADEILARSWFKRQIPLERIEQAILIGCARKYSSWRNNPRHGSIRSLRFFESVLDELKQQDVASDYWDYLRSRLERIEKRWIEDHTKTEGGQDRE
jgi:hypothetical protein